MTIPTTPIADWTDDQLWNVQLMLQIGCQRGKQTITKKRQSYLCFTNNALTLEAIRRGVASPAPPLSTNQLRPGAL